MVAAASQGDAARAPGGAAYSMALAQKAAPEGRSVLNSARQHAKDEEAR